ncbi:MAG: hypothetical protein AAFN93_28635, partial [Bacteroidota bacterium]
MIKKKYIRKIDSYISAIDEETNFHIALLDVTKFEPRLKRIGFGELQSGIQILPGIVGKVSSYNAEGKYRKRKDLPKETVYYPREWTWQEFHGRDNRVERTKIVDVPYKRYRREVIPPPAEELRLVEKDGQLYLTSRVLTMGKTSPEEIKHIINLFLELFGECEILTQELSLPFNFEVRRLNWEILPPGEHPWKKVRSEVTQVIKRKEEAQQIVIRSRLDIFEGFNPEFVAVGRGGFRGYLIFAFPEKNLFVLENMKYGNATYAFEGNWKELSQLTKSEIIAGELHEARIIHRIKTWKREITLLPGDCGAAM